jgi:protease IV
MKKSLVRFLAWVGGIVLLYVVVVALVLVLRKGHVPSKTILEANFEQQMIEDAPDDPVATVMLSDRPRVRDVVDALDKGAGDDRVQGLVARIGAVPMGMSETQELREAVLRFRAKKKFAVAFAETFGEFGPGNASYYLATAFDQIYLQPSGDVGLNGLMLESPFIKGTLGKLGVKFHGDHRYQYKNALNFYTETKYTAPHKEAMQKVLDSWFAQLKDGVCEARHLDPNQFADLVNRGPFLGKEAMDAKLVDGLAYRDEVYEQAKKKAPGAELLYLAKYLERAGRPHDSGKTVALIYGVGGVTRGESDFSPVNGSVTMGSETVAGAFRAAIDDKDVKAILFRVDSPGGSYVASDTIWREVVRARKAGKPVIVSMGDLAGSGGYFVAMAADKIVAQPGTITASIGVLGGKMVTNGLWDKVGLSWDDVHTSANSTMFTGTHDYNKTEWARFESWLDRVYEDFTSKVADGRKLPKEKVLQIAKGRIWSGADAKELGLVDELGGFDTALKLTKKAIGVSESDEVKIVVFPHRKRPIEMLLARGGADSSEKEAATRALTDVLRVVQPVVMRAEAVGLIKEDQAEDVLRMEAMEMQR